MSDKRNIQLYFFPTANPKKITIMLEECELPYDVHVVNVGKGDQFNPEFLKIGPNNRVPAIVDPQGPGRKPISLFDSGAILQYLGEKTGKFYPKDLRERSYVNEWLFWQASGLGPMSGQAHHFAHFAKEKIPYAMTRYSDEVHRLYGVMNIRLRDSEYLAGKYSIADIACYPWIVHHSAAGHPGLEDFPNLKRWFENVGARPGVQKGYNIRVEFEPASDEEARRWTFNQRAREVGR